MASSLGRPPTRFDIAAARLLSAFGSQIGVQPESDDYRLVLVTLTRFAQGFGLAKPEAEDVATEAIAETFVRSTDDAKDAIRQPSSYLFWLTRNRVFDRHRRTRLREDAELSAAVRYYSREDDSITAWLDEDARTEDLEDALRAAAAAGDMIVVHVVTAWLALAERYGEAPTSRQVGPDAGVSHTTVNQALRRLSSYFPAGDAGASTKQTKGMN